MVRFSGVVCALLLAGVAAIAGAETVYKWVDRTGQVHYTDLPPRQADARILGVYQKEAGTIDEEASDDFDDASGDEPDDEGEQPGSAPPPEPPVSQEAMAAAEADALKAKVEHCKAAQDRYQRYIESRRLYRETADGKRVYLTDQELTTARARAKQDVDNYCS